MVKYTPHIKVQESAQVYTSSSLTPNEFELQDEFADDVLVCAFCGESEYTVDFIPYTEWKKSGKPECVHCCQRISEID
jgi:hypothetical protein